MSPLNLFRNILLAAALLAATGVVQAQTATWTGASGGSWNTPGNWDVLVVPGLGTNAVIGSAVTVNYSSAMSAATFSNLVLSGAAVLNVGASGFNMESGNTAKNVTIGVTGSSGTLNINSGGAMTLTNSGQLYISTNGLLVVNAGGSLIITNTLNSSDAMLVGDNRRYAAATSRARFQVLGGTATIDKRVTIAGSTSGTTVGLGSEIFVDSGSLNLLGGAQINNTTDDGACRFLINGGTVNLGNFIMARSSTTPGTGFVISNGVVNATALQVGTSASRAYAGIYGGVLTNTGVFHVSDTTTAASSGDRKAHFQMLGGTAVSWN